jgi:hypothetical protein
MPLASPTCNRRPSGCRATRLKRHVESKLPACQACRYAEAESVQLTPGRRVPQKWDEHLHDTVPLRPERALPVGREEAEEDALRHNIIQADVLRPRDKTVG